MLVPEVSYRLGGRYLGLLDQWRKRMNLTGPMGPRTLAVRFFLEAVPAVAWLARGDGPVVDVGSGAGFPGVPLAILIQERRFVLLEPRMKRWGFLRMIARELPLGNVDVLRGRVAEAPGLGSVRTLVARGVGLERLDLESTSFLRGPGLAGRVVLWTSSARPPHLPGFELLGVDRVSMPGDRQLGVVLVEVRRSGDSRARQRDPQGA